jgi:16S rRNA processing protein RimM
VDPQELAPSAIVPETGQIGASVSRDPRRTVPLGRIVDAWGVRGWVKVEPFAGAGDTALLGASVWHLQRPAAPAHAPIDRWLNLERSRRHASTVVAKPEGVEDRTGALALKGAEVGVRRMDFPPLPEGEVYWVDLEGCAVVNLAGESFGTVVSVDDHGAHPIIETDTGHLIPFVDAYVVDAVPAEGRIVVDWQADWSR